MNPCLVKMAAVALLAAAGTYTGTTLAESPPPAAPVTAETQYIMDLQAAGLPVPSNAVNAGHIICANLHGGVTVPQQAAAFLTTHPGWTTAMADQYIAITQKDLCQ
jgi:hypothetical protein